MKWWQIALAVVDNPAFKLIPVVGQVGPLIADGVVAAQHLHGDTNNDAKRQIVVDGALAASATGKVNINPTAALAVTDAILTAVDSIHQVVKDNTPVPTPSAPA